METLEQYVKYVQSPQSELNRRRSDVFVVNFEQVLRIAVVCFHC